MARAIVVTGSGGISAAVIRALTEDRVFILGGSQEEIAALSPQCPQISGHYLADLRKEEEVAKGFVHAESNLGKITDVIGIVGGSGRKFGDGPLSELSKEAWDATLELNLTTAALTAKYALHHLHEGSVTLTSSVLATSHSPEYFQTAAYATAKAGIEGLVKFLASTYAAWKIRINAVAPGLTATPMAARAAGDQRVASYAELKQPLVGGFLQPEDLVPAYLYLLEARAVTGEILTVDGGWSSVRNH